MNFNASASLEKPSHDLKERILERSRDEKRKIPLTDCEATVHAESIILNGDKDRGDSGNTWETGRLTKSGS